MSRILSASFILFSAVLADKAFFVAAIISLEFTSSVLFAFHVFGLIKPSPILDSREVPSDVVSQITLLPIHNRLLECAPLTGAARTISMPIKARKSSSSQERRMIIVEAETH